LISKPTQVAAAPAAAANAPMIGPIEKLGKGILARL
jgi:hypothetical protein